MRATTVVLVLVGCGRFGFDGSSRDSNIVADAFEQTADTPVGQPCSTDAECGRCARCEGTCQVEPINELYLGHRSLCYVGTGGTRWCAGQNNDGQLGLGDIIDRSLPTRALDGGGWDKIWLNYYATAKAVRNNELYQWGGGTAILEPMLVGAAPPIRDVLGDINFKCYWAMDGTASCDPSGSTWSELSFGADHFCGIKLDNTLWCWGINQTNDLGFSAAPDANIPNPTQVGTANNWVQVTTGGNLTRGSSCARTTGNQIYCWGHPKLTGTNQTDVGFTPTLVNTDSDWMWLKGDWENHCAGKADGSVYCWGDDTYGGFVAVGQTSAFVPTRIPGTYTRWEMGGHHSCGIENGKWRCFGWNEAGQLGVGNTINDGQLVDLCP